ncbi:C3a anaphylatoxin chemotactic receptor [Sapajus apella]|uniref:C3a anaphylatoxin chemotactic receptor n=1 Tax=Sapajus apella TaxID=9515 RepID=A0A6J3H7Q6_SAPAP|nr:C3a anaphylatoxin chemotactic receptor [Sapajus apella]
MESFSAEINSTDLLLRPWSKPPEILSMVILSLTFLLGLPGNGLVLWVAGLKMKRTVNTVWFLHLTLADLLCCLSLPFSLAHLALQGKWPYGSFLCKLIPSIIVLNMFASVFLLTAISLDRCLVVLKPIWCQNHRSVGTAFTICGCIWMMAFVMCIPMFMYREIFTIDNHNTCGYRFDSFNSFDYSDFYGDLLKNRSSENMVQLPEEMDDRLDPSPFQTNDHPWTGTSLLQPQTFQRPSADSLPRDSARLTTQNPYSNVFKPADVVSSKIHSGFPIEDHKTSPPDNSDGFLSTHLELFPRASSNSLYESELPQDFQDYYYLGQFTYDNQGPTPMVAIVITRLVVGFLLPSVIMVTCYSLIVFRMQRGRFAKSQGKTFRVAVVVVTVFLVCWAPYHIMGVLLLFIQPETPLGGALMSWDHVSIALASANSCFNPFLYALLGKDFRKKARQSIQGILEAAFSEELTHSTHCSLNNVVSERNSISTTV